MSFWNVALLIAEVATPRPTPARAMTIVEPRASMATLWDSAAAMKDCVEANSVAVVAAAERGYADAVAGRYGNSNQQATEPEVCTAATVATLTRGTEIAVENESGRCGEMKRVEVVSGKNEGKKGCLRPEDISAPSRPTPQP